MCTKQVYTWPGAEKRCLWEEWKLVEFGHCFQIRLPLGQSLVPLLQGGKAPAVIGDTTKELSSQIYQLRRKMLMELLTEITHCQGGLGKKASANLLSEDCYVA